jgi:hypothetical protein
MKFKGSSPRSQELVTCPHPVTDKSSPASLSYSFKTYFNIILTPTLVFSKEFFSRKVAPLKSYAKFISTHWTYALPALDTCPPRTPFYCPQSDRSDNIDHVVRFIHLLTEQYFS